jgi:two-component system cell cycle response regulator CpdR
MPPSTHTLSSLPHDLGRALVVDDEPVIRSLYSEVLQAMGFKVDTAADGQEGVERLQGSSYNLIISDIRMPRMTGIEFILKADQIRPGSQGRFIFTTGLLDSLNAHEYLIATERPCIMKPAKVENIQQTVIDFLRENGFSLS